MLGRLVAKSKARAPEGSSYLLMNRCRLPSCFCVFSFQRTILTHPLLTCGDSLLPNADHAWGTSR